MEFTVILVLTSMVVILAFCIWAASWEWEDRTRKQSAYAEPLYPEMYVDVSKIRGARSGDCMYDTTRGTYQRN